MCSLIGGETAGKTDGQYIAAQGIHDGHNLMRRVMAGYLGVGDTFLYHLYHPGAELAADIPDHLVIHGVDTLEALLVVLVGGKLGAEDLGMYSLPLGSCPGRIVNSVGHVTDMQLLRQIARPQSSEYLLADLAVHPAHAVDLLGEVAGQVAHGELLVVVGGVDLAESHHGLPVYLHPLGIMVHVGAEQVLAEGIVTGRHGRMGGEERRAPYQLQRLVVGNAGGHILAQTLQSDEGCVALVAVIDVAVDTQGAQGADTADTEQQLLFQTVLPVTSVEMVGNLTVLGQVVLEVRIEQIEFRAAHIHFPDLGVDCTSGEDYRHHLPVAVLIPYGHGRNFEEVLGLVVGHLVSLSGKSLAEIAVTVEQSHTGHLHPHVAGLLEVVTCQNTQTPGVNLQGSVQAVLHTEIGYRG
ncbi:unknown [Alistipes sp. CAG:831]|nr:unknown [Alistipes sp. CAG:831]